MAIINDEIQVRRKNIYGHQEGHHGAESRWFEYYARGRVVTLVITLPTSEDALVHNLQGGTIASALARRIESAHAQRDS